MQGVLQWEDNGEESHMSGLKIQLNYIIVVNLKWQKPFGIGLNSHDSSGSFIKDEVKSIFAYVDAYAPPATAQGPATDDTVYEAEDETVSFWWWIIIGLMVFVLFATFGVRRELSEVIAAKRARKLILKKHL